MYDSMQLFCRLTLPAVGGSSGSIGDSLRLACREETQKTDVNMGSIKWPAAFR